MYKFKFLAHGRQKPLNSMFSGIMSPDIGLFYAECLNISKIKSSPIVPHIEGILPKGPYPPCLRMADRALLAGYPRYMRCWTGSSLVYLIACSLFCAKPLSKTMANSNKSHTNEHFSMKNIETNQFSLTKLYLKLSSVIFPPFLSKGCDELTERYSSSQTTAYMEARRIIFFLMRMVQSA